MKTSIKLLLVSLGFIIMTSCQKENIVQQNLTVDLKNARAGGGGSTGGTNMQLIFSTSQTFVAKWVFEVPTENRKKYIIRIKGLYSDGGGANNLDAAFDLRTNSPYNNCVGDASSRWRFVNSCSIRPSNDVVTSTHIYDYNFTSNGTPFKFDFSDDCCYWDNSGKLDFEIYKLGK